MQTRFQFQGPTEVLNVTRVKGRRYQVNGHLSPEAARQQVV